MGRPTKLEGIKREIERLNAAVVKAKEELAATLGVQRGVLLEKVRASLAPLAADLEDGNYTFTIADGKVAEKVTFSHKLKVITGGNGDRGDLYRRLYAEGKSVRDIAAENSTSAGSVYRAIGNLGTEGRQTLEKARASK